MCFLTNHKKVDWNTANAAKPSLHIGEANVQVLPDTSFGDASWNVGVQEVVSSDMNILPSDKYLIRGGHIFVEDVGRN